jgi:hypothetical protein
MTMKRLACLMIVATACGGADGPDPIDEEACLHLQQGPFQDLTAGADRDSSAPDVSDDHVAYVIGGDGFVQVGVGEAGDYLFFYDADVAVEYTDSFGEVVTPEEVVAGSEACDEIARRDVVPLAVGTTFLELSGNDEVTIVIEHGEHEHEE